MSEYLNQIIDFDNVFIDPSSESYDLIHSLLKENSKGFSLCAKNKIYIGDASKLNDEFESTKQLNNAMKLQICVNPTNNDIGKEIAYFGCCPPPINVINMVDAHHRGGSVIHILSERGGYDEVGSKIIKQMNFTINDNDKKRNKSLQIDISSSSDPINNCKEELFDENCNSDVEESPNPDSYEKLHNTITDDICQTIHDTTASTAAIVVPFKITPIKKRGGGLRKRKRKSHFTSVSRTNNNTNVISNYDNNTNSNSITPATTLSIVQTDNVSDIASKCIEDIIDYKSDLFTMLQNHFTNIFQLLNKNKEKPVFELEILKNDQIVNKNKSFSQSLYDYFTEIGYDFDISPTLENHNLSIRGRHFYDLMEEEEFLLKLSYKSELQPVLDWHHMFSDWYSDNHDGYYREWLRNQQEETKRKLMEESKANKKKRINADPIFRAQSNSLDVKREDLSLLSNIVAPPVPVAIHHPACWGINSRIHSYSDALKRNGISDDNSHIDKGIHGSNKESNSIFELIHPACYSNEIITPIHKKVTPNSNQSDIIPCKYNSCIVVPYQDVDDFNIFVDKINQDLELLETDNYLKLLRLQHIIKVNENSNKLQSKRQKLEDLLYRAVCKNEPTNADRLIYSSKGKVKQGHYKKQNVEVATIDDSYSINKSSLEESNSMKASLLSRYNTRYSASDDINDNCRATASLVNNTSSRYHRNIMGASSINQVSNGNATNKILKRNAQIEFYVDKTWKIGTIIKVIRDRGLIRHVKVRALEVVEENMGIWSTTSLPITVWIAVEDGHLAPVGTYLRPHKKQHATNISNTSKTSHELGNIQNIDQIINHSSSISSAYIKSEENNNKRDIPIHEFISSDNDCSKIDSNGYILPVNTISRNISDYNLNVNPLVLSSHILKHPLPEANIEKEVTDSIILTSVQSHNNIVINNDIEKSNSSQSDDLDLLCDNCFGVRHEKNIYDISPTLPSPLKESQISRKELNESSENLLDPSFYKQASAIVDQINYKSQQQRISFDYKPSSMNTNSKYVNTSLLSEPSSKLYSHQAMQQPHVLRIDQPTDRTMMNLNHFNNNDITTNTTTASDIITNINLKRLHSINNLQNEFSPNKRMNFNSLDAVMNNISNKNIYKPIYEMNNNELIRKPILKNVVDLNSERMMTSDFARDVTISSSNNISNTLGGPTITTATTISMTTAHNNSISSGAAVTFRLGKNTITKNN